MPEASDSKSKKRTSSAHLEELLAGRLEAIESGVWSSCSGFVIGRWRSSVVALSEASRAFCLSQCNGIFLIHNGIGTLVRLEYLEEAQMPPPCLGY